MRRICVELNNPYSPQDDASVVWVEAEHIPRQGESIRATIKGIVRTARVMEVSYDLATMVPTVRALFPALSTPEAVDEALKEGEDPFVVVRSSQVKPRRGRPPGSKNKSA